MKFRWPLVTRKTLQKTCDDLTRQANISKAYLEAEHRRKIEKTEGPILKAMSGFVKVSAERRPETGRYILHFQLDETMIRHVSRSNDEVVWRWVAEKVGYDIERQLRTLNFAKLNDMALDHDNRISGIDFSAHRRL